LCALASSSFIAAQGAGRARDVNVADLQRRLRAQGAWLGD